MNQNFAPIGVTDSGIGGLTVVRELQRLLPGEDILYFGDSANCPYGNKTAEEIFSLGRSMLEFLREKQVKCVATACNTTSSMVERLQQCVDYPVISIVQSAAEEVIAKKLPSVGLIATEFTVASGKYQELIHKGLPQCKVAAIGSPRLAALVDRGDFCEDEIRSEIRERVSLLMEQEPVEHLILGCTHYPIVEAQFRACLPGMKFINPACGQARAVQCVLESRGALNPGKHGSFTIFTSGDPEVYLVACRRLQLRLPDAVQQVSLSAAATI